MSTDDQNQTVKATSSVNHRRRGKELEADILASTFELIERKKYEDITMDMIAKNAHTNKSVLYRRWESKAEIVLAAFRAQNFNLHDTFQETPNTGSLEGDLKELFAMIIGLIADMPYEHIIGLMKERLGGISMRDFFDKMARKNRISQMIQTFFEQAEGRGEIDLTYFDNALYDLPVLMLIDSFYAGDGIQLDQGYFDHLVDDILMPVYRQFLAL